MKPIQLTFSGEQIGLEVDQNHYQRRLGFPKNYDPPGHIMETMEWASQWFHKQGDPWLELYEVKVSMFNEDIYLNDHRIRAPKVLKRFKKYGVEKALLIAATAGDKVDLETRSLWSSGHPDKGFFLETYAASVTEILIEFAVVQIKEWAHLKGVKSLSRYSPGYPGWELNEQRILMDIIYQYQKDIPISLSETSLLSPLKSQLSLVGIHRNEQDEKEIKAACMQCDFNNCSCRKKEIYIKE